MIIQPMVESTLNDAFSLDDDTSLELMDRVGPNLLTNVSSHLICNALLTPLQLIRTRSLYYLSLPTTTTTTLLTGSLELENGSPERRCRR